MTGVQTCALPISDDTQQDIILRSFREWGRGCYCVGPEANKLKCGTCGKRFNNWIETLPDEIFDHKYVYDEIGYNLKIIELQGSMGLKQLNKLPTEYLEQLYNELGVDAFRKGFAESFIDEDKVVDSARDFYIDDIYQNPESYLSDDKRMLSAKQKDFIAKIGRAHV